MKNVLLKNPLPRMASIAAALFGAAVTLTAQSGSPIGPWDIVMRGDQKGIAQITFNNDFTLSGREVVTVNPDSKKSVDPRGGLTGGIRVDGPASTNGTTNVYFYGSTEITGVWGFDSAGRIVGILIEGEGDLVNGVSLRGKRVGSRLTLVGRHEGRTIHYRGVPRADVVDISGRYYVTGKRDGQPYVSIFDLHPDPDAIPNAYVMVPFMPPFDYTNGTVLVSRQNYLAIASLEPVGTNVVLSAISGSFNTNRSRGSLSGIDEIHMRVTAKVQRVGIAE
jgi:hypothetical protein